jgi:hypothetical protein
MIHIPSNYHIKKKIKKARKFTFKEGNKNNAKKTPEKKSKTQLYTKLRYIWVFPNIRRQLYLLFLQDFMNKRCLCLLLLGFRNIFGNQHVQTGNKLEHLLWGFI